MDTEDKQPRILKPSSRTILRKSLLKYTAYLCLVLFLIFGISKLYIATKHKLEDKKSSQLTSKVATFKKKHTVCDDGLKQLGGVVSPTFAKNTSFNIPAREAALDYITSCTFFEGDTKGALNYASQLDALYAQDGSKSASKRQALDRYIKYMTSYEQ